jgi:hypothetical protein
VSPYEYALCSRWRGFVPDLGFAGRDYLFGRVPLSVELTPREHLVSVTDQGRMGLLGWFGVTNGLKYIRKCDDVADDSSEPVRLGFVRSV